MASLASRFRRLGMIRVQILNSSYTTMVQGQFPNQSTAPATSFTPPVPIKVHFKNPAASKFSGSDARTGRHQIGDNVSRKDKIKFHVTTAHFKNPAASKFSGQDAGIGRHQIGYNVSRKDKIKFLVTTLLDIEDNKEAIYGALDAWVAWEQTFPIASLKMVLISLEKEHQWHRIVQVIKWMLSKGHGTTMGTYRQLIRALDMDHRAKEAHKFWMKRIGTDDLYSVPWQLCHVMISVYYRNNMLESLVKLFRGLQALDRKPTDKLIVQKVANAYEMLGLPEEKDKVLKKYKDLFSDTQSGKASKSRKASSKKKNKAGQGSPVAVASVEEGSNAPGRRLEQRGGVLF